jgi:hypothetical protein
VGTQGYSPIQDHVVDRFVIGDETLSRPSSAASPLPFACTVNSFILCPLLGNVGSHEDLTSGLPGHQAKNGFLAVARNRCRGGPHLADPG